MLQFSRLLLPLRYQDRMIIHRHFWMLLEEAFHMLHALLKKKNSWSEQCRECRDVNEGTRSSKIAEEIGEARDPFFF